MPLKSFTSRQQGEILACAILWRVLPFNIEVGGINTRATARVLESIGGATEIKLAAGAIHLLPGSEANIILAGVRWDHDLVADLITALEEAKKTFQDIAQAAVVMSPASKQLYAALHAHPWDLHLFEV